MKLVSEEEAKRLYSTVEYADTEPQYTEHPLLVHSFPVGTYFYVSGGHWYGMVLADENGKKRLLIGVDIKSIEKATNWDNTISIDKVKSISVSTNTMKGRDYYVESGPEGLKFYEDTPIIVAEEKEPPLVHHSVDIYLKDTILIEGMEITTDMATNHEAAIKQRVDDFLYKHIRYHSKLLDKE